jgi:cytochrome o ubiquinol oxidase operon protein cyoD
MKHEHGTIQNYVIGFGLSIVFTLVPYYLAVSHVVMGITLFATILVFALLQALVQVLFFLHLGRERNPRWQTGFLVATAGAILIVTGATFWIMYHLHENMMPTEVELKLAQDEGIAQVGGQKTGACVGGNHAMHMVMIENGVASPMHTNARKCDSIMFMNEDNVSRDIAFGPHEHHETYGGVEELLLSKGQSQTLVLNESGTQTFHDHLHEQTTGDFTVTP